MSFTYSCILYIQLVLLCTVFKLLPSREALYRILMTVLSRQLTQNQFVKLLERLGFNNKIVINYTEFFSLFRKMNDEDSSFPKWMDPVQRTHLEKALMNADQVHQQLREKAKQRYILTLCSDCLQIWTSWNNRLLFQSEEIYQSCFNWNKVLRVIPGKRTCYLNEFHYVKLSCYINFSYSLLFLFSFQLILFSNICFYLFVFASFSVGFLLVNVLDRRHCFLSRKNQVQEIKLDCISGSWT